MELEELQKVATENEALEKRLTKRNEQYVFDLKKSLRAANFSQTELTLALQDILVQLVDGQKTGKTARQLFGTVAECTQSILEAPKKSSQAVNPWLMWLDTTLLMFAFLCVMFSILPMIMGGKTKNSANGIITLIAISAAAGFMMLLMDHYIYRYDRPGADASKKPGFFKSFLIMSGGVLVWLVVYMGSLLIPVSINVVLDPFITIIIGLVAFGVRYLLKKKYNIKSLFAVRQ